MALMNDVNNGRSRFFVMATSMHIRFRRHDNVDSIDDVNSNYYIFAVSMQQCRRQILTFLD